MKIKWIAFWLIVLDFVLWAGFFGAGYRMGKSNQKQECAKVLKCYGACEDLMFLTPDDPKVAQELMDKMNECLE